MKRNPAKGRGSWDRPYDPKPKPERLPRSSVPYPSAAVHIGITPELRRLAYDSLAEARKRPLYFGKADRKSRLEIDPLVFNLNVENAIIGGRYLDSPPHAVLSNRVGHQIPSNEFAPGIVESEHPKQHTEQMNASETTMGRCIDCLKDKKSNERRYRYE